MAKCCYGRCTGAEGCYRAEELAKQERASVIDASIRILKRAGYEVIPPRRHDPDDLRLMFPSQP